MSAFRFLFIAALWAAPAVAQPAYHMGQGLCFVNKDAGLTKAVWGLGALARKKGACQGMSSIVAAFMERVEFDPARPRIDGDITETMIKGMMKEYRRGCARRVLRIPGYRNLNELCSDHREFFLKQAIWNNADIAVNEIAGRLIDFLSRRNRPIAAARDRTDMAHAIRTFRYWLGLGRKPLILVYSHVMTVLDVQDTLSEAGTPQTILWLYDPNTNSVSRYEVNLDPDGLPSRGQKKFWEITPNRGC